MVSPAETPCSGDRSRRFLFLLNGLQILSQYAQIIPQDKFAMLINTVARTAFGFKEDLIPEAGVFSVERRPQEQSVV